MDSFKQIHEIVANHHESAKDWKAKTGRKVLGYLNLNMPEELVYAAGVLPVRILGSHESETVTDPYMWDAMHCVSMRDCLAQGLQGRYTYLDGIVEILGCPHTLQCYYSWVRHAPVAYSYELYVPSALNGHYAQACLRNEIEDFKHSLESWLQTTITNSAIDEAIAEYNLTRRLMNQLSELRKTDNPALSGSEFMEVAIAGMVIDKKEFNVLLGQLVREASQRPAGHKNGARIMLAGSCNSNLGLIKSIESIGVQVVVDDHSHGGRYYMTEVVPESDRLNALAGRIVRSPRRALYDLPQRTCHHHLAQLAKEYRAHGVIFLLQRGCDSQQFDLPANQAFLEQEGIPSLALEMDFTNPLAQFRTRIEAFLEMLQARVS